MFWKSVYEFRLRFYVSVATEKWLLSFFHSTTKELKYSHNQGNLSKKIFIPINITTTQIEGTIL